ncbi:hypothetical protein ASPCAL04840 [Aspergillus calidoustus]|uniref:Allantoate permease n=1 Tax=Aspergillus calidoustus TaxID=454130 RepID=A0A0U5FZ95_ASPCI|nr:hypothetical protein ASPCAL04840 [Aspergillus calidoustus]
MIISSVWPCMGIVVISLLPNTSEHRWVKWGMFDMRDVFSLALFLSWVTSSVTGRTKRNVVSALTLVSYCVGNMIGAQVFQSKDAPRYIPGTITCCVCFGLGVILIIVWRLWYMYMNRRRDRLAAESGLSEEELKQMGMQLGMQDKTDL